MASRDISPTITGATPESAAPLDGLAGYLHDQALLAESDAENRVGSAKHRLLAEADDCRRWIGSLSQRCETCSHWPFSETDWQFDGLKMGKCAAVRQREDIIEPARQIEDWDAREAEETRLLGEAKAIAVDGSGYYAALRTTADFGCSLYAALTSQASEGK